MFEKMTVRAIILTGFIVVTFIGTIVASVGIFNMAKMNDQAEIAYSGDLLGLAALKDGNVNLIYIARNMRSVMLSRSADEKAKYLQLAETARKEMMKYLETARPLFRTAAARALFTELDSALADYESSRKELIQLAGDDAPEARAAAVEFMFGKLAVKANRVDELLKKLEINKEQAAEASAESAHEVYRQTRLLMLLLVGVSVAMGVGIGLFIAQRLTRQLGGEPSYAVEVAGAVAAGELSTAVLMRSGDEKSLLFAMESMRKSLVNIVQQVRTGTDSLATASNQIAAGNMDLSARTEEQASSLEETASSMEELTGTVKQNAENARQANILAVSASDVAQRGGKVVADVVTTMNSINDSSRKIVDIIAVIDGIAFQTNILALNAAVEAARAGEQGRGFAVVAAEVRNLAQRSAGAAKEIKTLINDSVVKVDAGGKLVGEAGATMAEIVASIRRVTDIVSEIADATGEQTLGIEQINAAIAQMDQVTQQNAALVEEAAAAASSMQEQSAALADVVSIFKLGALDTAGAKRFGASQTGAGRRLAPSRQAKPGGSVALLERGD